MKQSSAKLKEGAAREPRALVLVVDDEASICSTLTGVLSDENFATLTAHDGLDAVLKVQSFKPDLVFLDMWMPGSDGIETLEKIKQISPSTEVIMISGHATISNALEATKRGAFDFIEKPLGIEAVLESAERALDRRQSQRSRERSPERATPRQAEESGRNPSLLAHPGLLSKTLRGRNLGQRTLKQSVVLYGHALHSGQKSGLVLEPLPLDSGIHFARMGDSRAVPAYVDYVESTDLATTLRSGDTTAATIEHLMAALSAYRISNLLVKCNSEVPIFDGSAKEFCSVIESVGIEEQGGEWYELAIDEPLTFHADQKKRSSGVEDLVNETITFEPGEGFSVVYELQYPHPIGRQLVEFRLDGPESFKNEIAPARTFGFLKDIERLQKAGLAAGGRLDNFILIGPEIILNTELRFPDELARHKILDIMGDLSLMGRPLAGKITARMTGHSDNVGLLRTIKSHIQRIEAAKE
ncbi:MAG: UDP-3-O-acyl-N-acetylglucosamine deacetylase [Bdellovibrionota bacterium]